MAVDIEELYGEHHSNFFLNLQIEGIVHICTNPKHNGISDQINALFVWAKFLKKNVVFVGKNSLLNEANFRQ